MRRLIIGFMVWEDEEKLHLLLCTRIKFDRTFEDRTLWNAGTSCAIKTKDALQLC